MSKGNPKGPNKSIHSLRKDKHHVNNPRFNPTAMSAAEGSPAEEASESPQMEAQEQAQGMGDQGPMM